MRYLRIYCLRYLNIIFLGPSLYIPSGESPDFGTNNSVKAEPGDNRENRGLQLPKDTLETEETGDDVRLLGSIGPAARKPYVIYGVEIGLSIFAGILMITTNALLSMCLDYHP